MPPPWLASASRCASAACSRSKTRSTWTCRWPASIRSQRPARPTGSGSTRKPVARRLRLPRYGSRSSGETPLGTETRMPPGRSTGERAPRRRSRGSRSPRRGRRPASAKFSLAVVDHPVRPRARPATPACSRAGGARSPRRRAPWRSAPPGGRPRRRRRGPAGRRPPARGSCRRRPARRSAPPAAAPPPPRWESDRGLRREVARGRRHVLGVGTGLAREPGHPEDLVADREAGHARRDLGDDAGDVPADADRRLAEHPGDAAPRSAS